MTLQEVSERLSSEWEICDEATGRLFRSARVTKIAALVAQLILGIAVGLFGGTYGPLLGLAAAVPPTIIAIDRLLAWQDASGWHLRKRNKIDQLKLQLARGEPPLDVFGAFLQLERTMADEFPQGSLS